MIGSLAVYVSHYCRYPTIIVPLGHVDELFHPLFWVCRDFCTGHERDWCVVCVVCWVVECPRWRASWPSSDALADRSSTPWALWDERFNHGRSLEHGRCSKELVTVILLSQGEAPESASIDPALLLLHWQLEAAHSGLQLVV